MRGGRDFLDLRKSEGWARISPGGSASFGILYAAAKAATLKAKL